MRITRVIRNAVFLFIIILIGFINPAKVFAQDNSSLWKCKLGLNFNYLGNKTPDFTFPAGVGLIIEVTLNKLSNIKPTIEFNVIGFPAFVIGRSLDKHNGITISTFCIGAKFMNTTRFSTSLITGLSMISSEGPKLAAKPILELHTKNNKTSVQFYYLKVFNCQSINGYTGISFLFKLGTVK